MANGKNWLRTSLAMLALFPSLAGATGLSPVGNWLRANGTVRIAVNQCGAQFCAVNTWVKSNGPEKVGDRLILNLKPVSGNEFKGTAYDVRRQRTYRMTVTFQGNDMETSGCILFGIICRSTDWHRLN